MFQKKILLPTKLKTVSEDDFKGVYEIDKLYPGYGHTLGNSLRRVIMSSIPGIAITRVYINGVAHEFSVIDGVLEDTINIILNLKKVVFRIDSSNDKTFRINLKTKKKGKITANDLEVPSQVEIVNPDQYLFSSEGKNEVEIEFEITEGFGYVSKEEIKGSKKIAPGEIIMDASFTPIKRVSYDVTSTRVGDRTDFNKISIFIETDGSVKPSEVITTSIKTLIQQFSAVLGGDNISEYSQDDDLSKSIADSITKLDLDESILGKIAKAGILKISELKEKINDGIDDISDEDFEKIKKVLSE